MISVYYLHGFGAGLETRIRGRGRARAASRKLIDCVFDKAARSLPICSGCGRRGSGGQRCSVDFSARTGPFPILMSAHSSHELVRKGKSKRPQMWVSVHPQAAKYYQDNPLLDRIIPLAEVDHLSVTGWHRSARHSWPQVALPFFMIRVVSRISWHTTHGASTSRAAYDCGRARIITIRSSWSMGCRCSARMFRSSCTASRGRFGLQERSMTGR
jgi:hypothetical protein